MTIRIIHIVSNFISAFQGSDPVVAVVRVANCQHRCARIAKDLRVAVVISPSIGISSAYSHRVGCETSRGKNPYEGKSKIREL